MERRRFLIDVAGLAIGSLLTDSALASGTSSRRLGVLGMQVSALHDELSKDFSGTLANVAELGYREIELVWWFGSFDRSSKQLRAALDAAGLRAPSGHISAGALTRSLGASSGASSRPRPSAPHLHGFRVGCRSFCR